ncbi:DUF1574 domain-containing protein [Leptospira interrogans]|uniref:DUF1574 domain-containing protein n=1 Tax=Leptospira interrogans TaxID=173 RepID=UPI0002926237|nr:DUF1574 domain-containing protein [Leptospira interrogans]AJR16242.1 hypothetical protein LIL_20040 [Leptospira interrogans serovar Linhai str. 56609]EKO88736.1 PF07611 family protein [Leptospira interrogans serovar Grippotyphosa str. Andaman]EKP84072.1 PF07611 family protein [Leptospira interrogans serovar Grippotyphosa str. 2006006986]EKR84303.1 PF07611 family protein [Leptospira interrogans str. UI 08452]EMJ56237.1 PF07611 family protein [Leptospira interrogans str. UT126]
MKSKPFLWYPVLLFFAIFLFDKLFFLDQVRDYVKQEFTYIYYDVKKELLKEIVFKYGPDGEYTRNPEKKKKLMILMGSSRMLYFQNSDLLAFYPDWDIYNLSSAVTTPAYYLYFLEKLIKNGGVHPDLIVIETDPFQFNKNSTTFKKANLANSFDPIFILKYAWTFGKENVNYYFANFLFGVSYNKPYIGNVIKRFKNENSAMGELLKTMTIATLKSDKGNAISPAGAYVEKDFGKIQESARKTIGWIYPSYTPSEMQYEFYKKIFILQREENLKILFVRPGASSPMEKVLDELKIPETWSQKIKPIHDDWKIPLIDMSKDPYYACNSYADSGHISLDCYRPFIRFILLHYYLDPK